MEILLSEVDGENASFQHVILKAQLVIRNTCTSVIPNNFINARLSVKQHG